MVFASFYYLQPARALFKYWQAPSPLPNIFAVCTWFFNSWQTAVILYQFCLRIRLYYIFGSLEPSAYKLLRYLFALSLWDILKAFLVPGLAFCSVVPVYYLQNQEQKGQAFMALFLALCNFPVNAFSILIIFDLPPLKPQATASAKKLREQGKYLLTLEAITRDSRVSQLDAAFSSGKHLEILDILNEYTPELPRTQAFSCTMCWQGLLSILIYLVAVIPQGVWGQLTREGLDDMGVGAFFCWAGFF